MKVFTWILESIDLIKDLVYLNKFKHGLWARNILITSIVFPFAIYESAIAISRGTFFLHHTLIYLGCVLTKDDHKGRLAASLLIATFENIPQFLVVIFEMFNSVR